MNIATMYGGKYILEGELVDTKKALEKMMKVTKKDVIKVATDVFVASGLTCAIIGPLGERDITLPVTL